MVNAGMQGCPLNADEGDIQYEPDAKSAHEDSAFGTEVEAHLNYIPVYCQRKLPRGFLS